MRNGGFKLSASDSFLLYVGPFIGGLLMFLFIAVLVRLPGAALSKKFVSLGVLKGKTKAEIIAVAGKPRAISAAAGGKTVLQWLATGYHIALIFDENDVCEGISHNSRA